MLIFSSSLLFSIILLFFQQRNNRFHSFMEDHVTCVTKRRSTFSTITEFQLDSREIDFSTCPYLLPFSFFFLFFLCFSFFFFLSISRPCPFYRKNGTATFVAHLRRVYRSGHRQQVNCIVAADTPVSQYSPISWLFDEIPGDHLVIYVGSQQPFCIEFDSWFYTIFRIRVKANFETIVLNHWK